MRYRRIGSELFPPLAFTKGVIFWEGHVIHVIHAMVFVTCCTVTILPVIDAVLLVGSTSVSGTWNGSTF